MIQGVSAFLAIGAAPARWHRELAHQTAWVDMLRRATVWVEEDSAVGYALQSGPLFGQALIDLTAGETRPTTAQARSDRRTRSKPIGTLFPTTSEHHPPDSTRKRVHQSGADAPKSRASMNGPTISKKAGSRSIVEGGNVERRVRAPLTPASTGIERALLYQLAGGSLSAYGEERRPYAPRREGRRPNATGFQAKGQQRQQSAAALEAIARQDARSPGLWQRGLIARVGRTLDSANPNAPAQSVQEQELLSQQWAAPIDGPTAPLELLLNSAGLAERSQDAVGASERSSTQVGVAAEQRAMASDERDQLQHGGETARRDGDRFRQGDGRGMSQMFDGGDDGAQGQARQPMEHEQGRQVLPPTLVSLLPPLTTPQGVSVPPLPVATATVRLGSRMEAPSEEDLDVLAARIKRILDDEARRHGIDV